MLWVTPFLLVLLCHGTVCVFVRLLRESTHVGLTCLPGRWAWSSLAVKTTLVAASGEWFVTLSMLYIILGVVYEQPSFHLIGGINNRVPGAGSLTRSFTTFFEREQRCPFLPLPSWLFWLSCLKMVHDDNHRKCPQSKGSSRSSRSPPPHRMVMTTCAQWGSVANR
jgi:hypothetical protein